MFIESLVVKKGPERPVKQVKDAVVREKNKFSFLFAGPEKLPTFAARKGGREREGEGRKKIFFSFVNQNFAYLCRPETNGTRMARCRREIETVKKIGHHPTNRRDAVVR